jgi:hypothetical protein
MTIIQVQVQAISISILHPVPSNRDSQAYANNPSGSYSVDAQHTTPALYAAKSLLYPRNTQDWLVLVVLVFR